MRNIMLIDTTMLRIKSQSWNDSWNQHRSK